MAMFVSLVDWYRQRELCRCVWEGDGENCAMIVLVGATKRHLLCADNWDYLLLVSACGLMLSYNEKFYFLYHKTAAVGEACKNSTI